MKRIVSHLWFDREAVEATKFYVESFGENSKIVNVSQIKNTPSGDCDIVSFSLFGEDFIAISAGPLFKFNPAISFMINFDPSKDRNAKEKLDELWKKLSQRGKALMELQTYPWSKYYGWVQDKYGLSWQLILTNPEGEPRSTILPSLLFVDEAYGKAEKAVKFYIDVFGQTPFGNFSSKIGQMVRYGAGQEPNLEGTMMFSDFEICGKWFTAMDGVGKHDFSFNESVSFIVNCETQAEIDYFWGKLSAVPEAEQCGWLKDKFGVSWQIVPAAMSEMMGKGTHGQMKRVTEAFLKMKKFDIATLERAYEVE